MFRGMVKAGDAAAILALCLLNASLYVFFYREGAPGDYLVVEVAGQERERRRLERQDAFAVQGEAGASTIEIGDGRARFLSSPCLRKYCIRRGWIDRDRDIAVCVPNRVSIRIASASAAGEQGFDSINY